MFQFVKKSGWINAISGSNSMISYQNWFTVDEVLRMFDHFSALGYADGLKLFMTINNADDCLKFQPDLNRLQH
jgi:hypothetical protein